MLKITLLHPEILSALSRCGHGALVLLADGNYPVSTATPRDATRVFLNLAPDLVRVTDVLATLVEVVPIESATVMTPTDDAEPAVHAEFRAILPAGIQLTSLKRFEFYEEAMSSRTALVIATGEVRRFANLLLTIGVLKNEEEER